MAIHYVQTKKIFDFRESKQNTCVGLYCEPSYNDMYGLKTKSKGIYLDTTFIKNEQTVYIVVFKSIDYRGPIKKTIHFYVSDYL